MGLWGLHPTGLAQGLAQAGEGQGCVLPSVKTFFCRVLNPQQWARPRVAASRMRARKTRSYSPPQL